MKITHEKQVPYKIAGPDSVKTDMLDPVEYLYKGKRDIEIVISHPEHTSVCPMTGLPDNGEIILTYVPNDKIIELKSLKFYFFQYRNVGIFYEHIVNKILDDLVEVVKPKKMEVKGIFTPRGGISSTVIARYPE
ncbi:MAG: preQ(1) synthase [Desulforegulaceae bacterium]|jgi:7-cyano-7-deazaguanine reductase|nr:preQ(1) synthase [Desulforegulaceae bacterium]